ncbi:MAG: thioredoxin domain-containing protein [Syntrophobacteraceae bacterium]
MMREDRRQGLLLAAGVLGLFFAVLSGLSEHVKWLGGICNSVSDGCKETAEFTLMQIPMWLWGIVYFSVLVLLIIIRSLKQWVTWFVAGAVGIEIALVWIMISMKALCIYCIGNLIAITLLAIIVFERERFWQTLSLCMLFFMLSTYAIRNGDELHASTAENQGEPLVVAVVAGREITQRELEVPLASRIYELQRQIYQLKKNRLDEVIAEAVLDKEAKERSISPEQLIKDEVTSKGGNVSEEEVNAYYKANRSRVTDWKGTEEELKGRMRDTIQQQKNYTQVMVYAKSLETKYGVSTYLDEPQPLQTKVNIEGSPSLGPASAPVTVVEFSDYECPACRAVHDTVRKIRGMYAGRIRWVFKDFPLKMHEHAEKAALAGRCAAEQGKFWEYQDLLYGSKEGLQVEHLFKYANDLGLDPDRFKGCLDSGKYSTAIEKEKLDAKHAGIDRTPTFVINGKILIGSVPLDGFKEIIEKELKSSKPKP